MVNLGQAIGYLDLDTTGFKRGFNSALGDLKILRDQSATAADKFTAVGHSMTTIGSSLSKFVTVPLVGAGAAAVKFSSEFEKGMSEVKAITNATTDEMGKMKNAALELGATTAFSASEVAKGMSELGSAGFATSEILQAMSGLLDLAASSGTDLAAASEITASALRGFNLEASEAGHVADVFARAAADTNAGVVDMGEAMKFIAPVANSMGISIEETAAAIGLLSNAGIKGGQAGTTLRASLSRLAKPSDEAALAMEKMSFSAYTSEGTMKSLDQIISGLTSGMEGMTEQQKQNTIATIFGQEAMSGLMVLMEAGPDKINALEESFKNSDGAAKEMANTMMDNLSGSIEELFGALESLAIAFGDLLIPAVRSLTVWVTSLVQKLVDMDEGTKKTMVTVLGIVAALGPVLLIGGKIAAGIGSIMTTLTSLSAAAAVAGTTIGASIAAIAWPISAVVAAIIALSVAWKNNFGGVKETTKEIFGSIKDLIDIFWGWLTSIWENNLMGVQGWWNLIWIAVEKTFEQVFGTIKTFFGVWVSIFKGDFEGAWNILVEFWGRTWDRVKEIFSAWWDAWSTTFMQVWTAISDFFKGVWDAIVQWFKDAWDSIISFFTETVPAWIDSVIEFFAQLPYNLGIFVGEMIAHVLSFGREMWLWVTTELPKIIQGIIDWFAKLPMEIWNWLKKIVDNIVSWGIEARARSDEAAKNIWNAIIDWIKRLPAEIAKWFTDVLNYLKSLPSQMFQIGMSIMNGLWDGLKNVWSSISDWFTGVMDSIKSFFNGIEDGMDDVKKETSRATTSSPRSSNASGLDYVPYNGYIAELHEGERVLTAEEAKSQDKSEGDTYNFYSPVALTPVESAREMKKAKQELALGFA